MHYIYCITNLINNKKYIGETSDCEQRFLLHRKYGLRGYESPHKKNEKKGLYKDMKKYGLKNFKFEIIDTCNFEDRYIKERYWIEKLNTYRNGYNNSPYHGATNLISGVRKHSKSTKEILRIKNLGENNPMFGKKISEKHKQIISKTFKNKKLTDEHKAKISEARRKYKNIDIYYEGKLISTQEIVEDVVKFIKDNYSYKITERTVRNKIKNKELYRNKFLFICNEGC